MYYFPCAPLVQRDAESRMSRLARHCAVAGGHDCGSARRELPWYGRSRRGRRSRHRHGCTGGAYRVGSFARVGVSAADSRLQRSAVWLIEHLNVYVKRSLLFNNKLVTVGH